MTRLALNCTGLIKKYGQTEAIKSLTLELEKGKSLALLGPSGCGKTTLLRLIAGFETPDLGTINVGGTVVSSHGVSVPPEKRNVGIVFQEYALFPHLNVAANIAYGLPKNTDRQQKVTEMLSLVGLAGLQSRMPHELSGGEQQRVGIARALARDPEVLLLDEPFSNLDADLRSRIRTEVKEILARAGATVVFVTHDQEEALFMGDLVGVMNKGQLEQIDTPEGIFHRPATPFVGQFIGIADFIDGVIQNGTVSTEIGNLPRDTRLKQTGNVTVMIRPDFINIKPASDGIGIIDDRVFQGIHYLYQICLPSGAMLHSLQHHNHSYPIGSKVAITMNPGHKIVCF